MLRKSKNHIVSGTVVFVLFQLRSQFTVRHYKNVVNSPTNYKIKRKNTKQSGTEQKVTLLQCY